MSNNPSNLTNVPFKNAEVKIYSSNYKKEFTYSIEQKKTSPISREASFETIQSTYVTFQDIPESTILTSRDLAWTISPRPPRGATGGWRHQYLPTSRLYLGSRLSTFSGYPQRLSEEQTEDQLDLYFANNLQQLWARYSSGILKGVRKAQEDGLASILKAFLSAKEKRKLDKHVDPDVAFHRVADFLKRQGSPGSLGTLSNFENRYDSDSAFRSVVNDINEVEVRIEQAMSPRGTLQRLIQEMFSGNKKVLLEDNDVEIETLHNQKIGLNALSSGEKHLLRILIDTVSVGEGSILIDEPEISMHIDWQRQLINAMRQINSVSQIIIATHSPEIMADVPDDRIFRL